MFGLFLVIAFAGIVVIYQRSEDELANDFSQKVSTKLDKLWGIAQDSLRERKYLRAEKALLTILRVDERNATAYNRLGILYAKQKAFKDAIECFEIAQSLEPSASSLHNVGLIYYETGDYEKASLAFKQALGMEDSLAARHVAYAKVQEKLGHHKQMLESLQRAVDLEPTPQALNILADAYERNGMSEEATATRDKVSELIKAHVPRNIRQTRKVVM